jgi:hypothetical protein
MQFYYCIRIEQAPRGEFGGFDVEANECLFIVNFGTFSLRFIKYFLLPVMRSHLLSNEKKNLRHHHEVFNIETMKLCCESRRGCK